MSQYQNYSKKTKNSLAIDVENANSYFPRNNKYENNKFTKDTLQMPGYTKGNNKGTIKLNKYNRLVVKFNNNDQSSPSNEYQGLSYKKNMNVVSPTRSDDTNASEECLNTSAVNNNAQLNKRKNTDGDFRVKYKTEICKFWQLNKECRYGDNCAFAHGNVDIRNKGFVANNYKTKKCKQFFEAGYCPYGYRCQFRHSEREPLKRANTLPNNSTTKANFFSYKKIIQRLLNFELSESSKINVAEDIAPVKRPRLSSFATLTQNKESKSQLKLEENDKLAFSGNDFNSTMDKTFYDDLIDLKRTFSTCFNTNCWESTNKETESNFYVSDNLFFSQTFSDDLSVQVESERARFMSC